MESILFYIMAAIILVAGVTVILHRNPVKSALALIVVMLSLAILYLQLSASLLAMVQIMVYVGAIMVLFLFVIMILNVGVEAPFPGRFSRRAIAGLTGSLIGITLTGIVLLGTSGSNSIASPTVDSDFGSIERTGELLLTRYLLPFELISVLLLVAIIGAVLIIRPRWPVTNLPTELWPPSSDWPSDRPESSKIIAGDGAEGFSAEDAG